MFSSSMYESLLQDGVALGGIRSLSVNLDGGFLAVILKLTKRFFCEILPDLFFKYPVGAVFSSGALILDLLSRKKSPLRVFLSLLTAIACLGVCFVPMDAWFRGIMAVCLLICDFVVIVSANGKSLFKKLLLLILAPTVLVPLAVTTELGPRLYYLPCLLLIALGMCALPDFSPRLEKAVTYISSFLLIGCMLFYGGIYIQIRAVTVERANAVTAAIESGADEVIMKKDPHKYWWGRNCGEERMGFFKEFYGIPDNITVIFEE